MTTLSRRFVAVAGLVILLSACGGQVSEPTEEETGSNPPASGEAPQGTETPSATELVIAHHPFPAHLDRQILPGSSQLDQLYNVVDPVIRIGDDGELLPALAETWTAVDETTLRLELREDVVFADGEPFNAEAFKVSMDRFLLEESATGATFFPTLQEIQVVDEFTADLIHEPDVGLPVALAINATIYSPRAIEEDPESLKTQPIGSGPYEIESYEPGRIIRLVARDDYWGAEIYGEPAIRNVEFRASEEPGVRLSQFLAGEAQMAIDLTPDDISRVPESQVLAIPSPDLYFLRFDFEDSITSDPLVREAINLAIDRALLTEIFAGFGAPASQMWGENVTGWAPRDIPEPDFEEARALIQQAGVEGAELELRYSAEYKAGHGDLAETLAAMIGEIGISVSLTNMDGTSFRTYIRDIPGSAPLTLLSMSHETFEAIDNLPSRLSCGGPLSTYCNEEVDELTAEARSSSDRDERIAVVQQIADVLEEDIATVPLVHPPLLWVKADGLDVRYAQGQGVPFAEARFPAE